MTDTIAPIQGNWWLDEGRDSGVWPCEVLYYSRNIFGRVVKVRTTHPSSMYYGEEIAVDPARVYDSGFNRVSDAVEAVSNA